MITKLYVIVLILQHGSNTKRGSLLVEPHVPHLPQPSREPALPPSRHYPKIIIFVSTNKFDVVPFMPAAYHATSVSALMMISF